MYIYIYIYIYICSRSAAALMKPYAVSCAANVCPRMHARKGAHGRAGMRARERKHLRAFTFCRLQVSWH